MQTTNLCKIAKKFERLPVRFRGRGTQWRYREVSILKPEVKIQDVGCQTGSTCISASIRDSKESPTATVATRCSRGRESQLYYQKGSMSKPKVTRLKNKWCINYSKLHALYTSLTNCYNYVERVN